MSIHPDECLECVVEQLGGLARQEMVVLDSPVRMLNVLSTRWFAAVETSHAPRNESGWATSVNIFVSLARSRREV